jgi:uncharacterized delta-60 repeat protein
MMRSVGVVVLGVAAACGGGSETTDAPPSCTSHGAWDPSFGMNGSVVAADSVPYIMTADGVAMDDGFLIVGRTAFAPHKFALARYTADGSFDQSFGIGGIVQHQLGPGTGNGDEPFAIARAPDAKLVVSGWSDGPVVARFNANGTLDTGFQQGFVRVPAFEHIGANPTGIIVAGVDNANVGEAVVARLQHDGNLDATFATGGVMRDDIGNGTPIQLNAFALAPDGSTLIAGISTTGVPYLRRYTAQGARDSTFTPATLDPTVYVSAIHVLANGRILIALTRIANDSMPGTYVGVAALDPIGALDATFGNMGYAWSARLMDTGVSDVVVASTGTITLTGTTEGGSRMMAARFTPNGTPDTCFDDDGIGFGITAESPAAVIDAMDRITMLGHQYADPINTRLVVARVSP